MSLSGNLGFVSLDEILRLLTRSQQQGSVDVRGEGVRGRIFVTEGGIALATTFDETSLRHHLIRSGLVDEIYMETIESGEASLGPIAEQTNGGLTEFLREVSVESLYQLGLKGTGFEVSEGASTVFASPENFELEGLLEDSRQRLDEWTEVSQTVPDLGARLEFRTDLGDRDDITIDRDGWRVLSHIGAGSSVSALADRLGSTEFWTARVAARLINKNLVEFTPTSAEEETAELHDAQVESAATDPNESWWQEPADEETEDSAESPFEEAEQAVEVEEPETAEEREESRSMFGEYADRVEDSITETGEPEAEAEDESDEPQGEDDSDEPQGEDDSMIPALSEVEASDAAEVEEDTEAFLEKVFSELESGEEATPEQEEGYGLLRRRRMGAIRDTAGDV